MSKIKEVMVVRDSNYFWQILFIRHRTKKWKYFLKFSDSKGQQMTVARVMLEEEEFLELIDYMGKNESHVIKYGSGPS